MRLIQRQKFSAQQENDHPQGSVLPDTEQQMNGYEIEYVVAASGQEAARLNLPDDCVVLLA